MYVADQSTSRVSILLHWGNNEFNRLSHHPSWQSIRQCSATHSRPCCKHIYNTYTRHVLRPRARPPTEQWSHLVCRPGNGTDSFTCTCTPATLWRVPSPGTGEQNTVLTKVATRQKTRAQNAVHTISLYSYVHVHVHQVVRQKPTTTPF